MKGRTKPTLVDIMSSLCNITNSIKGIEQRLDKILNVSNIVDELETKYISLKKWFKEIESGQDLICSKFGKQEKKVAKITWENKELQKENNLLNKMIKWLDGNLEIKKKQKGKHWDNMTGGKWYRLLVYPTKVMKTVLKLFIKFVS